MNAAELRALEMKRTLRRMVESLETVFVGVTVEMLETLDFPAALRDYAGACERAVFEADTGVGPLPVGVAWPDDEATEPIRVGNR